MSWIEIDSALEKEWTFRSFSEAWSFLTQVALLAEKQNHHPEIQNVFNRVKLRLQTHDAGNTISDRDHKLAEAIDKIRLG